MWHEVGTGVEDIRLGNRGYGNGRLYGKDVWWDWVESYWWLFVTISKAFWHSDTCAAVLSLRLFPLNTSGNMRWHDTVACSQFMIKVALHYFDFKNELGRLWSIFWSEPLEMIILKVHFLNSPKKRLFLKWQNDNYFFILTNACWWKDINASASSRCDQPHQPFSHGHLFVWCPLTIVVQLHSFK